MMVYLRPAFRYPKQSMHTKNVSLYTPWKNHLPETGVSLVGEISPQQEMGAQGSVQCDRGQHRLDRAQL